MANTLAPRKASNSSSMSRRDPFAMLRHEVDDLRHRLWADQDDEWFSGGELPSVDMSETDNAVDVRMDLPGVKAEDIDIQVNGNLLTVMAERKDEKEEKGRTFHRVERHCGSFSRSLTLPSAVKDSEVAAQYHDGVLAITLPKSEPSKSHKIKVKG
jgi:HSP20 family protein